MGNRPRNSAKLAIISSKPPLAELQDFSLNFDMAPQYGHEEFSTALCPLAEKAHARSDAQIATGLADPLQPVQSPG